MKITIRRQGAYIGAGAGLVLFAIFGLLPGSLLGGAAGIKIAGLLFGLPLEPGLLSRVIVLASMLAGVLVAGTAIVTASSTIGWLFGAALGSPPSPSRREPVRDSLTHLAPDRRRFSMAGPRHAEWAHARPRRTPRRSSPSAAPRSKRPPPRAVRAASRMSMSVARRASRASSAPSCQSRNVPN